MAELTLAEKAYQSYKNKQGYSRVYQLYIKSGYPFGADCAASCADRFHSIPISIAIKVEDRGPLFYRSKRIGRGFQELDMLKFRSMKVNAPDIRNNDGSTYNSKKDPRVTRVGHIIRETSLDELPQLFNVLAGQMSIIGSTAGDVESKDTYEEDEKDKLLIRPGITGYTQAYYRNGLGVREKRLFDAWYAHNVSLFSGC